MAGSFAHFVGRMAGLALVLQSGVIGSVLLASQFEVSSFEGLGEYSSRVELDYLREAGWEVGGWRWDVAVRPGKFLRTITNARNTPRKFMKFHIETHGCKLNMADSQQLAREFVASGFEIPAWTRTCR